MTDTPGTNTMTLTRDKIARLLEMADIGLSPSAETVRALCILARRALDTEPRPISEAPKDGSHILAFFDDDVTPPTTLHWFGPPDLPGLRSGGWYVSVQDIGSDRRYYPKRFIPLSALPTPEVKP